jgi:rSAM/selenodomain-associated transferase 1
VFAKAPGRGGAKTRLASSVGQDGAALLARAFLADTWRVVEAVSGLRPILVTTDPSADHGLDVEIEVWDQGGGDLGERLERAFRAALAHAPAAIAIGADAPGMPAELLAAAVDGIRDHAAVLGSAEDGGFWTLGVRACPRGLLSGVPWSAPTTAHATRMCLVRHGMDVRELPSWWDIDTESDLVRWRQEIQRAHAPFTHAALDALWPPGATR